ncbi:hypothetical protein [Acinetobacter pittii]|uniref:hypothetical protein n=1 Tax=Acinetobacter pittii TaxID=48296 RepID=UPI0009BCEDDD|nr:hypothetical protein [Acinetobacter pittii]
MYQKRPYPQNDFLLIFANLTQMFNDAVCYFGNNSNKNAFKSLDFDIECGVSRFNLQQRLLEFYKKSKRQLTISETTSGMLVTRIFAITSLFATNQNWTNTASR